MSDRPADRIVFLSILIPLLAGDMLIPHAIIRQMGVWLWNHPNEVLTGFIGGAVGFAELVSWYRDAPWQVASLRPGLTYIALNAAAAILALFLITEFPQALHKPDSAIMTVILAGTGAMVVVRTRILTVHQPSGNDVAVGPAFVVETVMSAVNREVDRLRAQRRIDRVAPQATRLKDKPFAGARGYLAAQLAAFQNLDADVSKRLRDDLRSLDTDPDLKALDDEVKYLIAGYSILTEFGDPAFKAAFGALELYLDVK